MTRPTVGQLAAAVLAAGALAGCGSGSGSGGGSVTTAGSVTGAGATSTASSATSTTTTQTGTVGRLPSRRRPPPRLRGPAQNRPAGPPVGHTQEVHAGGETLAVTVTGVLDPLRGGGTHPLPGSRPVGVQITIVNRAGPTYDSTASGDVSVIVSRGAAAPLFVKSGVCQTPDADFESLIGAGETRSGCVGFSVPRGARVLGVRFSPHSRAPGSVSWR